MRPLPPTQWDESLRPVLDDMKDRPLNVHCLMANHPKLLQSWWDFRKYAVSGGDLSQRDCELIILRVSVHMKVWYEWASHVDRGLSSGLSLAEIQRVKRGPDATAWNERDKFLLTAVDELIESRGIGATTQDGLARHLTANQVMDVISIHSAYVMLACMINTWGLELDAHVLERLPESVTPDDFATGL